MALDRVVREEFPFYYAPGKRVFQIVLKLKDVQGGLAEALRLMQAHVNLVSVHAYRLGDGTAIFSGFAEATGPAGDVTIKKAVARAPAVIGAEVIEGRDGLIVDSFHLGVKVGTGRVILMSAVPLSNTFAKVAQVFGSGGEVIIFQEGRDFGSAAAKAYVNLFGREMLNAAGQELANNYASLGYGVGTLLPLGPGEVYRARVEDCFECSGRHEGRSSCSFMRGVIEGFAAVLNGTKVSGQEPKCRYKGDPECEFVVSKVG